MKFKSIEDNNWLYRGQLIKWKDDGRASVVIDINLYIRDCNGHRSGFTMVSYMSDCGVTGEIDAASFGVMTETIT